MKRRSFPLFVLATLAPNLCAQQLTTEDLTRTARAIEQDVATIRGLAFEKPVQVGWMSPQGLIEYGKKRLASVQSVAEYEHQSEALRLYGLIPWDMNLLETSLALVAEQAGGFYDPATSTFYLMEGMAMTEPILKVIMAHELTHALEDQHYHLDTLLGVGADEHDDDASLAGQCLAEGSATYLMTQWMMTAVKGGNFDMGSLMEFQKAEQERFQKVEDAPIFLQWSLVAPYLAGNLFLMKDAGMLAMTKKMKPEDYTQVFENPPKSSEQILHPNKYWKAEERDEPSRITMTFGGDQEVLFENVLGELVLSALFHGDDGKLSMARITSSSMSLKGWRHAAASGWDADRYYLVKDAHGDHPYLAWATMWDSADERVEFQQAWVEYLGKLPGVQTAVVGSGPYCWTVIGREGATLPPVARLVLQTEVEVR